MTYDYNIDNNNDSNHHHHDSHPHPRVLCDAVVAVELADPRSIHTATLAIPRTQGVV